MKSLLLQHFDWLGTFSREKNFEITVINHASEIDKSLLIKI